MSINIMLIVSPSSLSMSSIWIMISPNPERTALEGIRRLMDFLEIGMPTNLEELGVPDHRLEEMASKCKRPNNGRLGYFVPLTEKDILEILKLCR